MERQVEDPNEDAEAVSHAEVIKVTLTGGELIAASIVGAYRHIAAIVGARKDAHGCDGDGWEKHIEGACGELAVAKTLRMYWPATVNTFAAPDLG
jgi:hypothetical protein